MNEKQDLLQMLGQVAVFSALSEEDLRHIAQTCVLHTYNAGEMVFFEKDEIASVLVVYAGDVAVFKRAADGREQILSHLRAGEIVSVVPLVLHQNACHAASGRAATTTQILSITPRLFEALCAKNAAFNRTLLEHLAGKLEQLSELAASLSLQSARSRLAAFLIKHADQPRQSAGITQEEIAAEIGTVREIVARLLRDFSQLGWLKRERQRLILINKAALEEEARRW